MSWLKNETSASLRTITLQVFEQDGVTPAPTTAKFQALQATLNLNGLATGSLANVLLTFVGAGAAGDLVSLAITADGAGAGSLTNVGNAYTFHYQSGVTTVNNMIAALAAVATFTGAFTGTNTLAAGDAITAHNFSGGQDSVVFLTPIGGARTTAAGALTNDNGIPGRFKYVATQAETNVDCVGWDLDIGTPDANNHFVVGGVTYDFATTQIEQRRGSWDDLEEGSYTHADMARAKTAVLLGKVSNFLTTFLAFLSIDGTKTRVSGQTDPSGRIVNPTLTDLSGP